MKLERFTTYRKKNSGTLSLEEESEDLNSFDEGEQFNKKDLISGDIGFTNEETE